MGTRVITGPTEEPVTLAETAQHLRVAISDDDGLIAGYILAARTYVEGQTHRPICSRVYEYTIDYAWPHCEYGTAIELPLPPLQAVSSITYVDSDGVTQTLAANQYTVITARPKGAVVPAYNATWPTVRNVPEAITVRFIAGYTNCTDGATSVIGPGVPDDLRVAIMTHTEILYDRDPQSHELLEATRDVLISPYMVPTF